MCDKVVCERWCVKHGVSKVVLKAVLGTWPVVLMAVLMSSVAGVFIWALVSLSPYKKKVQVFKINCNVKNGSAAMKGWTFNTERDLLRSRSQSLFSVIPADF